MEVNSSDLNHPLDTSHDEVEAMKREFDWLICEEVTGILEQLNSIILECANHLPLTLPNVTSSVKSEKYPLETTGEPNQLRALVTLTGDAISHADISIKLHSSAPHRTIVQTECPWRLQQIQDAANHLSAAYQFLSSHLEMDQSSSADEILQMVTVMLGCLNRGRSSLLNPRKKPLDEILNNKNMKSLQPPLPTDLAISFYIQAHKLTFAVYHIHSKASKKDFEVYHVECLVPWLNEVIVLYTVAMQLCQQILDKIRTFMQYQAMDVIFPSS